MSLPQAGDKLAAALQANDFQTAERILRKTEPQMRSNPQWLLLLLHVLDNLQKYAEVAKYSAQLIAVAPAQPDNFYICYGRALLKIGQARACAGLLCRCFAEGAKDPDLIYTLAAAESYLGHHDEARSYYEAAWQARPAELRLQRALGMHRLKLENPDRVVMDFSFDDLFERKSRYAWPRWKGQELQGKKFLIIAEQGIGDIIMWLGFIPYLLAQGAECSLALPRDMHSLAARSFPNARILLVERNTPQEWEKESFDYYCPLGDLMLLCPGIYQPRQKKSYLLANPDRIHKAREKYNALGKSLKVGISWHTIHPETGVYRSIPLYEWLPLLQLENCHFINLQYGESADDLKMLQRQHRITVHDILACDPLQEREDFAAHIAALDAVVSIQNSTVHFAGALGVPTALMLPAGGDYRWRTEGNENWWYESVTTLRQRHCGEWEDVLEQAASWLAERAK